MSQPNRRLVFPRQQRFLLPFPQKGCGLVTWIYGPSSSSESAGADGRQAYIPVKMPGQVNQGLVSVDHGQDESSLLV